MCGLLLVAGIELSAELSAEMVQLRNQLMTSFSIDISPTLFYTYATPLALAEFIANEAAPDSSAGMSLELQVAAFVMDTLNKGVGLDEPLMAAGIDSLGDL